MRKADCGALGTLGLLAAYIWLRDTTWRASADDTLPILAALPVFALLLRPRTWLGGEWRLEPRLLAVSACLFPAGALLNSAALLAAGWTGLLASWLAGRTKEGLDSTTRKLLVLPFLSFPWISTDFQRIGWWFRMSGAWAAEKALAWTPLEISRHGVNLMVNHFVLSVEPACSGVNGLEAMLIAGTAMAWLKLGRSGLFWWNLPVLAAAAWAANLIRIVFAGLCVGFLGGAWLDRWFGPLHLLGGFLALCAMFGLCWLLFSLEAGERRRGPRRLIRRPVESRCFDLALALYCAWRCKPMLEAWLRNPYDRLGWLAFLLWLAPSLVSRFGGGSVRPGPARGMAWRAGGLLLVLLGDIGDLNFSRDWGLALVLTGVGYRRAPAAWVACALVWMPAAGWLASRLGTTPAEFVWARILAAAAASVWMLARLAGNNLKSWASPAPPLLPNSSRRPLEPLP